MSEIKRFGIYSGKGGVGKTTIVANIVIILSQMGYKILAGDTDVDAPNLSILLRSSNFVADKMDSIKVKTTEKARLLLDKCISCHMCVNENFCHFNAISWDEKLNLPKIDFIACEGCQACKFLCPNNAFSIEPVESGTISTLRSPYGFSVITGETILGAQTSGKLVTEMKKYAENIAINSACNIIIYDGPPGIGCPVIASISGLDYVIVVIEPTTAALHDARRFIEVVQSFKIPYGIIINKVDIWAEGATQIRKYLAQNHIELLGAIPLDPEWPFSVAKRQPFVIYRPKSKITAIFQDIVTKLQIIMNFKEVKKNFL